MHTAPASSQPLIRVLIVDDESLARSLVCSLVDQDPALQVIGECRDGEAALVEIRAQQPDLVFLDVHMPLLGGVQLVRQLAATEKVLPYIIFLTAFDQYAIEAFEYNALDYLVKPVQKARFRQSLERAKQAIRQSHLCDLATRIVSLAGGQPESYTDNDIGAESLLVWQGAEAVNINISDIVWVEAANQYVRVHLAKTEYMLTQSLGAFYKKLNRPQFQRVHRSAIINTQCLQRVTRQANGAYQLMLSGGIELPLARSRRTLLPTLLRLSQQSSQV